MKALFLSGPADGEVRDYKSHATVVNVDVKDPKFPTRKRMAQVRYNCSRRLSTSSVSVFIHHEWPPEGDQAAYFLQHKALIGVKKEAEEAEVLG